MNGTNADATQVMNNFTTLLNCINNLTSTGALRGYVSGLTLSTAGSSANFAVAAGVATSDDTSTSMALATSLSKTTAAWAVGSGTGALDTGTIANNTWYHVFLVERTDTSVVDILFSLSATGPTLPANYTKKRRIGSMKTNGSSQWTKFVQLGDTFLWDIPVATASLTESTTAQLITLATPSSVKVRPIFTSFTTSTIDSYYYSSPDTSDTTPGNTTGTMRLNSAIAYQQVGPNIWTNTSSQIRHRSDGSGASFNVNTQGWIDARGKDD